MCEKGPGAVRAEQHAGDFLTNPNTSSLHRVHGYVNLRMLRPMRKPPGQCENKKARISGRGSARTRRTYTNIQRE